MLKSLFSCACCDSEKPPTPPQTELVGVAALLTGVACVFVCACSYLVRARCKVSARNAESCTAIKGTYSLKEAKAAEAWIQQQMTAFNTVKRLDRAWLDEVGWTNECEAYLQHRLEKRGDDVQRRALMMGWFVLKVLQRPPSLHMFSPAEMSAEEVARVVAIAGPGVVRTGDPWLWGMMAWRRSRTGQSYAKSTQRNLINTSTHLCFLLPTYVAARQRSAHGHSIAKARTAVRAARRTRGSDGMDEAAVQRLQEEAQRRLEAAMTAASEHTRMTKFDPDLLRTSYNCMQREANSTRQAVRREIDDGTTAQRQLARGSCPPGGLCSWYIVALAAIMLYTPPSVCERLLEWQARAATALEANREVPKPPYSAADMANCLKTLALCMLAAVGVPLRYQNLGNLGREDVIVEAEDDESSGPHDVRVRILLTARYKTEKAEASSKPTKLSFEYEYPRQLAYLVKVCNAARSGIQELLRRPRPSKSKRKGRASARSRTPVKLAFDDAYFVGVQGGRLGRKAFADWVHALGHSIFGNLVGNLSPHKIRHAFVGLLDQLGICDDPKAWDDVAAAMWVCRCWWLRLLCTSLAHTLIRLLVVVTGLVVAPQFNSITWLSASPNAQTP